MKKTSGSSSRWLLLSLANFVLLGGCMKKSDHQAQGQNPDISRQQTLKLNFTDGDIPSLNPQELALSARGLALSKWLFESLTRLSISGEYELAGAADVTVSSCKKHYTFTLRPNYYSDGTMVLAKDYEDCWKQAISPSSKCGKAHLLYCIKNAQQAKQGKVPLEEVGIKALDEHTLLVELTDPIPYFLKLLASPVFAVFKIFGDTPLFSGPYQVDKWEKERCLSLSPNPFFWNSAATSIKEITILSIKDDKTNLYLYENREIDWLGPPFADLPSDVMRLKIAQGHFLERPNIRPLWIHLNTTSSLLSSRPIRKALSLVIDRKSIADHIFAQCTPLFTPLPNSISFLDFSYQETCDLKRGKELFEQGLKEIGQTLETLPIITLGCCHNADLKKCAEYLKETWQNAFGIQIQLEVQEWNVYIKRLTAGKYDIGGLFFGPDFPDPISCLEPMAYATNYSKWNYPPYRHVIEQAKREQDPSLRHSLLKKAEYMLVEEAPMIPIVNELLYCSFPENLKGVCFDQRAIPDISRAFFEQIHSN